MVCYVVQIISVEQHLIFHTANIICRKWSSRCTRKWQSAVSVNTSQAGLHQTVPNPTVLMNHLMTHSTGMLNTFPLSNFCTMIANLLGHLLVGARIALPKMVVHFWLYYMYLQRKWKEKENMPDHSPKH